MKCFICFFAIVLLFFSCEDTSENTENTRDTLINRPNEETEAKIEIDDSDLKELPKDTGGIQEAIPLTATTANFGHYVYTPSGYNDNGATYPLLIFLHGWSPTLGEEPLSNVLIHGPPKLIASGDWKPSYPFVVVSPQLKTAYWEPGQIHQFIAYLLQNYHINTNRIYLTGLSLGAGGCIYYAGTIKDNYVAAIVPISGN